MKTEFQNTLNDTARDIGELLAAKNAAYGNSYETVPQMMLALYPDGIQPYQYGDALSIIRILDKLKRIVTNNDPGGEDPWVDIAGYAILQVVSRK